MLITTYAGLVVNTDYVAYIALKRQGTEDSEASVAGETGARFKVLLCLANGDAIVAACGLAQDAARFLRQDLGHWWAEGNRAYDVNHALKRHQEGAYFALDATESAGMERR